MLQLLFKVTRLVFFLPLLVLQQSCQTCKYPLFFKNEQLSLITPEGRVDFVKKDISEFESESITIPSYLLKDGLRWFVQVDDIHVIFDKPTYDSVFYIASKKQGSLLTSSKNRSRFLISDGKSTIYDYNSHEGVTKNLLSTTEAKYWPLEISVPTFISDKEAYQFDGKQFYSSQYQFISYENIRADTPSQWREESFQGRVFYFEIPFVHDNKEYTLVFRTEFEKKKVGCEYSVGVPATP